MERELRQLATDLSVKEGRVEGYAIVYNSVSGDLGGFKEIILPGAAKRSLGSNDILALYAHDTKAILGRTSSGTLALREDTKGVFYSLNLPNTQLGNDLKELIGRGDIRGASFAFSVPKGSDKWSVRDGQRIREVADMDVSEITLTAIPAYEATTAALRSMQEWDEKLKRMQMKVRLAQLEL